MEPNLSEDVLKLLRCPVSGQPLHQASEEELTGYSGDFTEGGFVTEDEQRAYPIRDGFPMLVESESATKN